MVCIPCIIIPVVLWIWHRYLQPIVLKFWNPWGKVEETKDKTLDSKPGEGKNENIMTENMSNHPNINENNVGKTCPFSAFSKQEVAADKKDD